MYRDYPIISKTHNKMKEDQKDQRLKKLIDFCRIRHLKNLGKGVHPKDLH